MTPPRTVKEEVAAKRALAVEKDAKLAKHAADDTHRRAEERRKAEAVEANKRRLAELHEAVEEAKRRLQSPNISPRERKALEGEQARLLRHIKRARV